MPAEGHRIDAEWRQYLAYTLGRWAAAGCPETGERTRCALEALQALDPGLAWWLQEQARAHGEGVAGYVAALSRVAERAKARAA